MSRTAANGRPTLSLKRNLLGNRGRSTYPFDHHRSSPGPRIVLAEPACDLLSLGIMQTEFEQSESNPASECPECTYPLVGLPPDGRCPECGYEYDHLTRIFGRRAPANLIIMGGMLEAFALLMLILVWQSGLPQRLGVSSAMLFAAVFVIAACFTIFLILALRQRKWSVARAVTGPEELRVQYGPGPLDRQIPWSDITGIRVTGRYLSFGAAVQLRNVDGKSFTRPEMPVEGVFQTRDDLEEFVRIVETRIGLRHE